MKKLFLGLSLAVVCISVAAQEPERLDSVVVSASRAGKNTPIAYENLGKEQLSRVNPHYSMPMALNLLPSVVTYNEGGTGLGNSAMTIRGSKGSQINVTLNGITLNDAESQEVFWVNIPALTGLVSSVQVQRGLGTTANGAGAFGASVNMNTAFVRPEPSASVEFSGGSYNTFITSASASSGLLKSGFYASAAFSYGSTDGYIRNAMVDSKSAFVALGWLGQNNSVRLTYLMGMQKSGITWDGIDLEQYKKDRRYNPAGEYTDEKGNIYYYPNQTDNYAQHHLQLNYTHSFSRSLAWTTTLNYTRGDGYDEYYKTSRKFKNYGFPALPAATPARSDMIYRKQMGNNYLVLNSDLMYRTSALNITGGINLSTYKGDHWGDMLWAKELGADYDYSAVDWYSNVGSKHDFGAFVRAEYSPLSWLTAYADLQYRGVIYRLEGVDDDWIEYGSSESDRLSFDRFWHFVNPRAGVTLGQGPHKGILSVAWGNREPGRGDIKENVKGVGSNPIRPEKMLDLELGYSYTGSVFSAGVNLYAMEYFDMLLETGRLSNAGYAIKENVPRAWRMGVELTAAVTPVGWLRVDGNASFSINQIDDYVSYVPYEDYSNVYAVHYGRTTMLMAPSVISMLRATVTPGQGWLISADFKYLSSQYLDNSSREEMKIPSYNLLNLMVSKDFRLGSGTLSLSAYANNLLGLEYYASGWRWESYDPATGKISYGIGVYPQATRNFMIKMRLTF